MAFIGAALGSGASAIGTALSAVGSIVGTISAISQAQYQAAVAKNNSIIAKNNAMLASEQSQSQQQQADQKARALMGEQEAIQAASGLTGRSQQLTRNSARRISRIDAMNIREAGAHDIQNFLQQSENYSAEAANATKSIGATLLSGFLDVGQTLIGGAKTTSSQLTSSGSWSNSLYAKPSVLYR